jgi:hypothetical protein
MATAIGQRSTCQKCGAVIVKARSKNGNTYTAQPVEWRGDYASRTLLPAHECSDQGKAHFDERNEMLLRHGIVVKGQRVRVTRGRKVPQGTEGIVFWHNELEGRAGVMTDAGDKVFVDAAYLTALVPVATDVIAEALAEHEAWVAENLPGMLEVFQEANVDVDAWIAQREAQVLERAVA